MEYQILSSKGDKVTLCIDDDMTVGDVKGIAGAMLNAPEDVAMTVSLNGKLLKDDDETWGEMCGRLFLNQPLHPMQRKLFCNVTNRPVVEPQSSEMLRMLPSKEEKKLEEERERAKIAMMDSMVDSIADNPAFLENIFAMNPAINKLKKRSPEVARMLNDPDTLRMLLKMSVDPQRRREMERNMELQLAQISALPGGADMINRYMTGYMKQELGTDPEEEEEEEDEGRSEKKLRVGTLTGEESSDVNHPDPTNKASSDPLPNPWASTPPTLSGGFSQPPGGFSFGGGGFPFANSLGYPSVAVPPFLGATPNPASLSHGGLFPAPPAPEEGGDAAGAAIKMVMQQGGSSLSVPQTTNTEAPSLGNASVAPMTSAPSSVLTEDTMQKGLSALYEMGFEDEALCREALTASGGDVEAAVDYIAERQRAFGRWGSGQNKASGYPMWAVPEGADANRIYTTDFVSGRRRNAYFTSNATKPGGRAGYETSHYAAEEDYARSTSHKRPICVFNSYTAAAGDWREQRGAADRVRATNPVALWRQSPTVVSRGAARTSRIYRRPMHTRGYGSTPHAMV